MGEGALNKLKWLVSRWAKTLGFFGLAGVSLIALAIMSYLALVLPSDVRIAHLAGELQSAKTVRSKVTVEDTAGQRVQKFYAFFPSKKSAPDLLERIYAAARDASIQLKQGKYTYTIGKTGKLGEYQVNFPVKGTYVQIRKFIAKVLNDVPSAALDDVSFKREAVTGTELDAKIRFTIFLGVN